MHKRALFASAIKIFIASVFLIVPENLSPFEYVDMLTSVLRELFGIKLMNIFQTCNLAMTTT